MSETAKPVLLPAPDALVRAVMERDAIEPGFAVAIARGVIAALPMADAVSLVGQPRKPPDPRAMIG